MREKPTTSFMQFWSWRHSYLKPSTHRAFPPLPSRLALWGSGWAGRSLYAPKHVIKSSRRLKHLFYSSTTLSSNHAEEQGTSSAALLWSLQQTHCRRRRYTHRTPAVWWLVEWLTPASSLYPQARSLTTKNETVRSWQNTYHGQHCALCIKT